MVIETLESPLARAPEVGVPAAPADTMEHLIAARKARGMSVSEVAAKLGMSNRQIDALERQDWAALPGHAFVRGALRSYAKAVGVEVEPLLRALGDQVIAPELRGTDRLDTAMARSGAFARTADGSTARLLWIALGIFAVIAMGVYFGNAFDIGGDGSRREADTPVARTGASPGTARPGTGSTSTATASSNSPAPTVASSAPSPSATGSGSGTAGTLATGGPGSPAAIAAVTGSAPSTLASAATPSETQASNAAAEAARAKAEAAVAAVPDGGLRFRFGRESWVEIRGPGNKVLLTGLQPAGSTKDVPGPGPFTLVVGNADHVVLERGGKPVDLAPSRARSGVARLKLE